MDINPEDCYIKLAKGCKTPEEYFERVCKITNDIISQMIVDYIFMKASEKAVSHLSEIYGDDFKNILSLPISVEKLISECLINLMDY